MNDAPRVNATINPDCLLGSPEPVPDLDELEGPALVAGADSEDGHLAGVLGGQTLKILDMGGVTMILSPRDASLGDTRALELCHWRGSPVLSVLSIWSTR